MGARFVQNKPNFKVLNLDDIIIMGNKAQQKELDLHNKQSFSTNSNQQVKTGRKLDI